ncbi:MAG: hypothetical protein JSW62_02400 [Thermoplasmatales archaeon]|nr:MAG: hypothetical protein JSW62_02400 [Thermoplasmatales archaeon]
MKKIIGIIIFLLIICSNIFIAGSAVNIKTELENKNSLSFEKTGLFEVRSGSIPVPFWVLVFASGSKLNVLFLTLYQRSPFPFGHGIDCDDPDFVWDCFNDRKLPGNRWSRWDQCYFTNEEKKEFNVAIHLIKCHSRPFTDVIRATVNVEANSNYVRCPPRVFFGIGDASIP